MITTEKKHWVDGHQIRGGYFNTYTASLLNRGILISWGDGRIGISLYRLV